jgi:hypothetical protein
MFKQKLLKVISPHPNLSAFAMGLILTLAIEMAIGGILVVDQSHLAHSAEGTGNPYQTFSAITVTS